jgi:phospholipid/cholesterol/gamma-HCH transport system ATP-binding protein
MDDSKIKIVNLHKSFNKKKILTGVNLDIYKNETFVIIGGSGTGKSVLVKHIVGLLKPDKGDIIVDGESIVNMSKKEIIKFVRKFGYVFQGAALFDSMNIEKNIRFGLERFYDYSEERMKNIVKEVLYQVGLEGIEKKMPSELSGGMKKRVAVARAIALRPEILIYDEPTTGLDPVLSDSISNLMINVKKEYNITSIVITHDMKNAYKTADRIGMLYKGKIIGIGNKEEIMNTDNPIIKQFIEGNSEGPIEF